MRTGVCSDEFLIMHTSNIIRCYGILLTWHSPFLIWKEFIVTLWISFDLWI